MRNPISILLVLLLGQARAAEDVSWRPYPGVLPGQGRTDVAVLSVRDGVTGRPIEGARVRRCPEMVMGPDGRWAPAWEEAVTDRAGLAWVAIEPGDEWTAHWAVDAPGYAPTEGYGTVTAETLELWPGETYHGVVLGPFGDPAPGVRVEWKVGCAHAPALREAVTDALGRFFLPSASREADVCLEGPGIRADYDDGAIAPLSRRPGRHAGRPGIAIEGRIVGRDRAWLAEAVVQSDTSSRGPLARVAPDGRFRLEGADPEGTLTLLHGKEDLDAVLLAEDYRPGGPLVWHVDGAPEEPAPVRSTVRLSLPPGTVLGPVANRTVVTVFLDRPGDGRRFSFEAEVEPGPASPRDVECPAGPYVLSVGGPFDPFGAGPRAVVVEEGATLDVALRPQPKLEVGGLRGLPEGASATLVLAVDEVAIGEDPVHLPADARAVVRVDHLDGVGWFPVSEDAKVRRAEVAWPRPAEIVMQLPAEEEPDAGARVEIEGRHVEAEIQDRVLTVRTHLRGPVHVYVQTDAGAWLAETVEVPEAGGSVAAQGPFLPPGTLVVDARATDVVARVADRTFELYAEDAEDPAAVGATFTSAGLRDGAKVRVLGRSATLAGPGPYTLSLGTASIRIEAAGEGGEPLDPVVWLDGAPAHEITLERDPDLPPGASDLWPLTAGRHHLIVAAEGHGAMETEVTLAEGEALVLEVRLPRAP
jgi:hypothetical protein